MKAIFLDIDGVLVHQAFWTECKEKGVSPYEHITGLIHDDPEKSIGVHLFDPKSVIRLNRITDETEAKIVLSSTWRFRGLEFMRQLFAQRDVTGELIDITPRFGGEIRGEEIQSWLEIWCYRGGHERPEKYIIIDDDSDMLEEQKPFFVHIKNGMVAGISDEHVERAIRLLL